MKTKPLAPVNLPISTEPVASTTSDNGNAREQELSNLREELEAQEALRAREREQKKDIVGGENKRKPLKGSIKQRRTEGGNGEIVA